MIILTGAAGFIGSHVAQRLAGAGERLILVDHPQHFRDRGYFGPEAVTLDHWAREKFPEERHKVVDRAYFLRVLSKLRPSAPASDPTAKEHVLLPPGEKITCVIHLGACTNTAETRKDFLQEWNVDYSRTIWNWCTEHGVPYIYASSGATYGG
ncbi:MAG: NAD-dependent epimerase/dehydratase family protein, partial [Bdellovibrionales bacterium]|nr:NAD-dependent epimerase/dehydratase family protein [Bdellovibrionales bacterium]